jgi:hypothetical protein
MENQNLKKKSKAVKNITLQQSQSKTFDKFYSYSQMRDQLINETWIEDLAKEVITWAENEKENLRFNVFLRKKGIDWDDYDILAVKFPILKKAKAYATHILGDKREYNSINYLGNANTINATLSYYCPDWHEVMKEKAELAKIDPNALQGDVKVIFERRTVVENANLKPEQIEEKKEKDGESTNNTK